MGLFGTLLNKVTGAFGSQAKPVSQNNEPKKVQEHKVQEPPKQENQTNSTYPDYLKMISMPAVPSLSFSDSILARLSGLGTGIYQTIFPGSFKKFHRLLLVDPTVEPFDVRKLRVANYHVMNLNEERPRDIPSIKFFIPGHGDEAVVLVPGARSTPRKYGRLAQALNSKGYAIGIGDIAGYGINSKIPLNEASMIDDVAAMIKKTAGAVPGNKTTVVGHSLGGANSTAALVKIFREEAKTGKYQVKPEKLILISVWKDLQSLIKDQLEPSENNGASKLEQIVSALDQNGQISNYLRDNLDKAPMIAQSMFAKEWNLVDSMKELLLLNAQRPVDYRLREINFFHGDKDPYVSIKRAKELEQDIHKMAPEIITRFTSITNGDHFDNSNDDQEFNEHLRAKVLSSFKSLSKPNHDFANLNLNDTQKQLQTLTNVGSAIAA